MSVDKKHKEIYSIFVLCENLTKNAIETLHDTKKYHSLRNECDESLKYYYNKLEIVQNIKRDYLHDNNLRIVND